MVERCQHRPGHAASGRRGPDAGRRRRRQGDHRVGFGSGVTTYKDSAATFNNDTIENFFGLDQIGNVTGLAATGTTVSWQFNASTITPSGTLDVFHNGALATAITLFGTGLSATTSFTPTTDGAGTGTLITDPQHLAAAH